MLITKEVKSVILEATRYASNDKFRPAMNGVLFKAEDGKLEIVCTDAHRLFKWKGHSQDTFSFILPTKTAKLLKSDDSIVQSRHGVLINGKKIEIVNARYPDYNAVIPTNEPYHVDLFDELDLSSAVKQVLGCAEPDTNAVQLNIYTDQLFTKCENAQAKADFKFKGNCPENFKVHLNGKFLAEMLRIPGSVLIRFTSVNKAFTFKREWNYGTLTRLLMPVYAYNDVDYTF